MQTSTRIKLGFFLWLCVFVYSFFSVMGVEPTGEGFTRGLNRLMIFFGWHVAALVGAIAVLMVGWRVESAGLKWLARTPALIHLLAVIAVLGAALWQYQTEKKAALSPQPGQQTAPATQTP
ncbi:MAG: hypothetical protein AAF337_15250 [Pseudomonadota bacterium]